MVRVVLMLILGIIVGEYTWQAFPVYIWPVLLVVVLLPDCIIRFRDCIESVLLLLCTFLIGASLTTLKERRSIVSFPLSEVEYRAVVASQPEVHGKTIRCDLILTTAEKPIRLKASILRDTITGRWSRLNVGDGIIACSVLEAPKNFVQSSNFDYARWLQVHGFSGQTFIYYDSWQKAVVDITSLSHLERARLRALQFRHMLVDQLGQLGLQDRQLALIAAMTLGDKSLLHKDLKEEYSISGASHILALSGLHLGIIYTILLLIFPRRRGRALTQIVSLLAIWTYALLVGLSPSVVRAALMISLYGMMSLLHRDRMSLNALALAALIMLLANPWNLWDVGFQMSFMAVLGIQMFYRMIFSAVGDRMPRVFRWLWGMIAVSFSAQIMVAPLVMFYFGRFSCYFMFTNLIVIPAATVILYAAFFLFLMSPFPFVQQGVAVILAQVAEWMNQAVAWISGLPGASIEHITIRLPQVVGIYLLIFCTYFFIRFVVYKLAYKSKDEVFR